MESNVFKVVLLQALPASGKSEVRNFMANIEPERLKKEFHIGENLQLDDFPYVHMMRRIDNELQAMGQARIFYPGEEPFIDGRDWGTLCCLLNEDYQDLMNRNVQKPDSAAQLLFDRYDRASRIAGIAPRLGKLPADIRKKLAEKLEAEAAAMLKEKQDAYPDTFDGKTIIIECARGGPDGASMPLTGSDGYQYSLPMFCPEILENAAILYIWVTPRGIFRHRVPPRNLPPQKRRPRRPQRSRLEPAPRRAAVGHAGRVRLRRYGISREDKRRSQHRDGKRVRNHVSRAHRHFR